jgi:hypothetical protein
MRTTDTLDEGTDKLDKAPPEPTEFSTLMLLLRAASLFNAKKWNGEVSTPTLAACQESECSRSEVVLAPLEALAAILVQHGEVIAVSYMSDTNAVVSTDSHTADSHTSDSHTAVSTTADSDVPDAIVPATLLKVNSEVTEIYPAQFSAVTNSTTTLDSQVTDPQVNPHDLKIIDHGEDLWANFKGQSFRWAYAL